MRSLLAAPAQLPAEWKMSSNFSITSMLVGLPFLSVYPVEPEGSVKKLIV